MTQKYWHGCLVFGFLICVCSLASTAMAQGFKIEKIDRTKKPVLALETVAPVASITGDREYLVKKGDALTTIAKAETGLSSNWVAIAEYNRLENADDLREGMLIMIPESLLESAVSETTTDRTVVTQKVDMFVGEIHVYDKAPVTRIAVGNGSIARVRVLDSNELLIIAEMEGSTSLRLWHMDGSQSDYNIRVSTSDPETRFRMEQMVNLRVKMVEFRKSALDRLGINWGDSLSGPTFATAGDLISNPLFRPESSELAADLPAGVKPFSSYFGIASSLTSRINALSASGDAELLAEPVLSCANGGSARFLAGGEVPYPTIGSNGQSSVDFKEYGIKLEVSPRIDMMGNVQTTVLAEISSIDPAVSVQGAPGLLTRRTQTQVNVHSGETIVISGLLKSEKGRDIERVPGLSRLPVVGTLFKSKNARSAISELVIFITPEVVGQKSTPDGFTPAGSAPLDIPPLTENQKQVELFSAARLSVAAQRLLVEVLD